MCDQNTKRSNWLTFWLAFLFLGLSLICGVIGAVLGTVARVDVLIASTAGSAMGALVGIEVLGGKSLLGVNGQSLRDMLRMGRWPLGISLAFCCLDLWGMLASGASFADDWPVRVCTIGVMCLLTGLAEETMFRGLALQGFLGVLGTNQRGIRIAAILSALIFGLLHIEWWGIERTNAMDLAQALLKTIQTGILGFYFAAITIQTRSIVCPALIHGLSNFLLMICAYGFMGMPIEIDYVNAGEDAWFTIALYVVMIALYAPLAFKGARILSKTQAPDRGAFVKAESE